MEVIQARDTVSIVELPSAANDYTLVIEFDDNASGGADWYEVVIAMSPLSAQPRLAPTNTDFALRCGAGISGRITDVETGLPIPNIRVKADSIDRNGPSASDTNTDANGRYTLSGVPEGKYIITAEGDWHGYIRQMYEDTFNWDDASLVTVRGTESVEGIDFSLKLGATISGKVIDAETGLPIAKMELSARLAEGDHIAWARTDGGGNYILRGLTDGFIEVVVDGREYMQERTKVRIGGTELLKGIDFDLRLGGSITGRITDVETGHPIPNVREKADSIDRNGPSASGTNTDADGRYILSGVPVGKYVITAEGDWNGYIRQMYEDTFKWDDASLVTVRGTELVEGVDFSPNPPMDRDGRREDSGSG